jgi:hypothetical protein
MDRHIPQAVETLQADYHDDVTATRFNTPKPPKAGM